MKTAISIVTSSFAARSLRALCCFAGLSLLVALPAAPASATPLPLTNLEVWLNADTLVGADGTTVANWTDVSGNTNNAVAFSGNTLTHPTLYNNIHNGHNAVRFTSATGLRNNTIASLNDMTVFAVYQWNSLSTQNWMWSFGSFDPEYGVGNQSINATIYDSNYRQYNTLAQTTGQLYRSMFHRSGGNLNLLRIAEQGSQTLSYAYSPTATTYQLGAQAFGSIDGAANVDIAEFIVYDGALDLATRAQVMQYLFERYDPDFVEAVAVPEPATAALLAVGFVSMTMIARRRTRVSRG